MTGRQPATTDAGNGSGDQRPEPVVDVERLFNRSRFLRLLRPALIRLADGPLMLGRFNADVAAWAQGARATEIAGALDILGVKPDCSDLDRTRLAGAGPTIVVSNHPFGALEMLALGAVLERHHPDFKLIGTQLLDRIEPLASRLIAVDSFGRWAPTTRNLAPMRAVLLHLRRGGTVLVYPAGRVSHLRLSRLAVTDPDWTPHVVRLARASGARIVPVFVSGRNSIGFSLAGLVHPLLRTFLLVRQLYSRSATGRVEFTTGAPIAIADLAGMDDRTAVGMLRAAVYGLGDKRNRD